MPQINDPASTSNRTSLTSFCFRQDGKVPSHAVSDTKYRYIRYADGFEELYDLERDRGEFRNLANDSNFSDVKERLAKSIPVDAVPQVDP